MRIKIWRYSKYTVILIQLKQILNIKIVTQTFCRWNNKLHLEYLLKMTQCDKFTVSWSRYALREIMGIGYNPENKTHRRISGFMGNALIPNRQQYFFCFCFSKIDMDVTQTKSIPI